MPFRPFRHATLTPSPELQQVALVIQAEAEYKTRFAEDTGDLGDDLLRDVFSPTRIAPEAVLHPLMADLPPFTWVPHLLASTLPELDPGGESAAAAGEAWIWCVHRGFFLALARLHRENTDLGRVPNHEWVRPPAATWRPVYDSISALGTTPRAEVVSREMRWLSYGTLQPFSQDVMRGAIAFVGAAEEDNVMNLYPVGPRRLGGLMMLQRLVAEGYAAGRCQQEAPLMREFLAKLQQ